jgi:hypothetical protein
MKLAMYVAVAVVLAWLAWHVWCTQPSWADKVIPTNGMMANPVPGKWWR